jgi:hypothetical protein
MEGDQIFPFYVYTCIRMKLRDRCRSTGACSNAAPRQMSNAPNQRESKSANASDIPKKVDAETRRTGVITGRVRQIFQTPTKVKTHSFRFGSLPAEGRQGCETGGDNLIFLIQLRRPYSDAREGPPSTTRRITRGDRRPGSGLGSQYPRVLRSHNRRSQIT